MASLFPSYCSIGLLVFRSSSTSCNRLRRCTWIRSIGGASSSVVGKTIPKKSLVRTLVVSAAAALIATSNTKVTGVQSLSYSGYSGGRGSSMPFNTERDGSGTITISPIHEADQSALVVISHGLGDTAEGFADVAEHLAQELPYCKFVLPTAPTQPVTMNMGMAMPSWYDITGLDERSNENCKGIEESAERLSSILETEHSKTKLPYERMVLMGFSQGGALSVWTGLRNPYRLAGIVMLSAYLPAASSFVIADEALDTPILHCHGTADPLVQFGMAQKTQSLLAEKGARKYELKPYAGVQHTVSMDEISDVKRFLKSILPPDDSCRIQLKDPSEMSVKELKAAIRKAGLGTKAVGLMEKQEFVKLLKDYRAGK